MYIIEKLFSQYAVHTLPQYCTTYEPRSEKTGLRGFRPGLTQTRLCNH